MDLEKRSLDLRHMLAVSDELPNGGFAGIANRSEVIDEYGCIVKRGAYKDLEKLTRDGFVPVGHDWGGLPVAYITKAEEREEGLYIEAAFHSTFPAQEARAVVQERIAAGKAVYLSIGFFTTKESQEEIDGRSIRILEEVEVKEVSLVTVPGTPGSAVTSARQGLRLPEELAAVRDAVGGIVRRFEGLKELRNRLSEENTQRVLTLAGEFEAAAADLRKLAEEPKTDPATDPAPLSDEELRQLSKWMETN